MATAPGTVQAICSPARARVSWNWRTLLWASRNRRPGRTTLRSILLMRLGRKIRILYETANVKPVFLEKKAIRPNYRSCVRWPARGLRQNLAGVRGPTFDTILILSLPFESKFIPMSSKTSCFDSGSSSGWKLAARSWFS